MDLFSKTDKMPASAKPSIHELWNFEDFLLGIEKQQINQIDEFLDEARMAFINWTLGDRSAEKWICMIQSDSSAMAIPQVHKFYQRQFLLQTMSLMAHRLISRNFVLKVADIRTHARGENIQTVYRMHLKPKAIVADRFQQEVYFRNIILETGLINDRLHQFTMRLSHDLQETTHAPTLFPAFFDEIIP